jgi:predicted TIM-barrel fold metal-dependent hydrolase
MLGVRCLLANYADTRRDTKLALSLRPDFLNGGYDRYWAYAEKYNVPMFFSAHDFAAELKVVAERHPNLTIIVDHFGITQSLIYRKQGDQWSALPGLLSLARYPNVYVKCCGTPVVSDQPFPFDDVWPHFHRVLKAFGPERCMWASDFTRMRWGVSYLPGQPTNVWPPRGQWRSYADCLYYLLYTKEISQTDKEHLFSGAVRRALRWPV